ncbi:uncharacterized protein MONOS_5009 [Monocercomonoides exilis]|uniref:uncharacterized protein n=1 Tax=Monocercomonoides exilis TaxID=2049356 RepID=UPI003559479C|nr:hypothetical protein MONOS_5009 [Monocercomonoides exilis]|eukprot:MONOS_5009.1-p1 / transcript=MONOS_5009.1 / gene=MONOS_5009 / organism=Monocercomonoides_exilis_PA203 / gene_product=unspecified product / transcript_product=unspecified product / location=Mono_scaffold00141:17063-22428(+) / protein_length=1735 / sequence_SO=supercontig / SO=protein_coding / is_pseudo=false
MNDNICGKCCETIEGLEKQKFNSLNVKLKDTPSISEEIESTAVQINGCMNVPSFSVQSLRERAINYSELASNELFGCSLVSHLADLCLLPSTEDSCIFLQFVLQSVLLSHSGCQMKKELHCLSCLVKRLATQPEPNGTRYERALDLIEKEERMCGACWSELQLENVMNEFCVEFAWRFAQLSGQRQRNEQQLAENVFRKETKLITAEDEARVFDEDELLLFSEFSETPPPSAFSFLNAVSNAETSLLPINAASSVHHSKLSPHSSFIISMVPFVASPLVQHHPLLSFLLLNAPHCSIPKRQPDCVAKAASFVAEVIVTIIKDTFGILDDCNEEEKEQSDIKTEDRNKDTSNSTKTISDKELTSEDKKSLEILRMSSLAEVAGCAMCLCPTDALRFGETIVSILGLDALSLKKLNSDANKKNSSGLLNNEEARPENESVSNVEKEAKLSNSIPSSFLSSSANSQGSLKKMSLNNEQLIFQQRRDLVVKWLWCVKRRGEETFNRVMNKWLELNMSKEKVNKDVTVEKPSLEKLSEILDRKEIRQIDVGDNTAEANDNINECSPSFSLASPVRGFSLSRSPPLPLPYLPSYQQKKEILPFILNDYDTRVLYQILVTQLECRKNASDEWHRRSRKLKLNENIYERKEEEEERENANKCLLEPTLHCHCDNDHDSDIPNSPSESKDSPFPSTSSSSSSALSSSFVDYCPFTSSETQILLAGSDLELHKAANVLYSLCCSSPELMEDAEIVWFFVPVANFAPKEASSSSSAHLSSKTQNKTSSNTASSASAATSSPSGTNSQPSSSSSAASASSATSSSSSLSVPKPSKPQYRRLIKNSQRIGSYLAWCDALYHHLVFLPFSTQQCALAPTLKIRDDEIVLDKYIQHMSYNITPDNPNDFSSASTKAKRQTIALSSPISVSSSIADLSKTTQDSLASSGTSRKTLLSTHSSLPNLHQPNAPPSSSLYSDPPPTFPESYPPPSRLSFKQVVASDHSPITYNSFTPPSPLSFVESAIQMFLSNAKERFSLNIWTAEWWADVNAQTEKEASSISNAQAKTISPKAEEAVPVPPPPSNAICECNDSSTTSSSQAPKALSISSPPPPPPPPPTPKSLDSSSPMCNSTSPSQATSSTSIVSVQLPRVTFSSDSSKKAQDESAKLNEMNQSETKINKPSISVGDEDKGDDDTSKCEQSDTSKSAGDEVVEDKAEKQKEQKETIHSTLKVSESECSSPVRRSTASTDRTRTLSSVSSLASNFSTRTRPLLLQLFAKENIGHIKRIPNADSLSVNEETDFEQQTNKAKINSQIELQSKFLGKALRNLKRSKAAFLSQLRLIVPGVGETLRKQLLSSKKQMKNAPSLCLRLTFLEMKMDGSPSSKVTDLAFKSVYYLAATAIPYSTDYGVSPQPGRNSTFDRKRREAKESSRKSILFDNKVFSSFNPAKNTTSRQQLETEMSDLFSQVALRKRTACHSFQSPLSSTLQETPVLQISLICDEGKVVDLSQPDEVDSQKTTITTFESRSSSSESDGYCFVGTESHDQQKTSSLTSPTASTSPLLSPSPNEQALSAQSKSDASDKSVAPTSSQNTSVPASSNSPTQTEKRSSSLTDPSADISPVSSLPSSSSASASSSASSSTSSSSSRDPFYGLPVLKTFRAANLTVQVITREEYSNFYEESLSQSKLCALVGSDEQIASVSAVSAPLKSPSFRFMLDNQSYGPCNRLRLTLFQPQNSRIDNSMKFAMFNPM